jgi:ABC-2 type transport system permease protein
VLGIGAVALLQLVVYAVVGCGLALATDALDLPSGALLTTVGGAVAPFLLGFAFFAFAYGATGSLVSRQEDVNSATTPVTTLAMAAYFAAVIAAQDASYGDGVP